MFKMKKDTPDVLELERVVDVRAGDIVILRCDVALVQKQRESIQKYLKDYEAAGVRFMVLEKCMSVETVLRFEPDFEDDEEPHHKGHL